MGDSRVREEESRGPVGRDLRLHTSMKWKTMSQLLPALLGMDRIRELRQLGERYGVRNIRVFGSYARGEARPDSDIDLLVSLEYERGVARRLVRFCAEASRLLGVKADVVTEHGLDTRLHARILREARPL